MDPIYLMEKFLKELRLRQADLTEVLKTGGVQDWEGYQKVLGELTGLSSAERILLDLQKSNEENNVSKGSFGKRSRR
jgi:hypothetical protein|tara:strand:+ start:5646 stop:5876 length:231 start_codon:yes stop_codon:yes gene_type:complete